MTPTERLELSTPGLEVRCAIQLRQDGFVIQYRPQYPYIKAISQKSLIPVLNYKYQSLFLLMQLECSTKI